MIALGTIGLLVAVLAFAEPYLATLAHLCGFAGGNCRDTAAYTLFGQPVAVWGLAYYVVLLGCILKAPTWTFRLIMAGAGVEATFFYALVAHRIFCPICMLNLVVVVALAVLIFRLPRAWEALALGLLFMVLSLAPFTSENLPQRNLARTDAEPAVVARVDGKPITAGDLERAMAGRIYDARMNLYKDKIKQLDQIIQERLLELEAQRLGTTVEKLRVEAVKDVAPVSAGDIDAYLTANPGGASNWQGSKAELRKRIGEHLSRSRVTSALNTFVDGLRSGRKVEVLLNEPPLPMTQVPLGASPSQGPADAPVTVVEFSDYLCPACRKAHEVVRTLRQTYEGRIRWVFKDLPLERHQAAFKMAEAARCAHDQKHFWEFQDLLFQAPKDLDPAGLVELAQTLGMDGAQFEQCIRDDTHRADVLEDMLAAREAGVDATPTFIVNGKLRPGLGRNNNLHALIEAELSASTPH